MDKTGNGNHRLSSGIKQDPISWMNGLTHPVTGEPLRGARWSPVTGCAANYPCWVRCWARIMATTRMARLGEHYQRFAPTFHPDRLNQPLHWRKPRAVFTCGMGDLFHEQIGGHDIANIFGVMAQAKQHLFIILTKRVQRALEWSQWGLHDATIRWPLPNVWLGTSVSNQAEADERISLLLQVPAALHMVSIEPMLGPVDLTHMDVEKHVGDADMYQINALTGKNTDMGRPCRPCPGKLGWVICGGETQPGARSCDPAWVRDLRDQCIRAGVPFHFKSWGTGGEIRGREIDGRTWEQVP